MYSQNNEQYYIEMYFSNKQGTFLDVGGYHPFTFSNTRRLYELGWNGVILEPIPELMEDFLKVYLNEPRIKLINAALTNVSGEIDFYKCMDAVSTSSESHRQLWADKGNMKYEKTKVKSVAVNDIIYDESGNIIVFDFINIDTEGTNIQTMNLFPDIIWNNAQMVCIEHEGFYELVKQKLFPFGYNHILTNPENIILAK